MNKATHALRTRWAAIGAAVAVTLGAGVGSGVLTINAAPLNDESDVVAIDPVRVVDTRSGVGLASSLESGVDYPRGMTGGTATTNGFVEVVPANATGVILNVTVVRPTSAGFLSVVPVTAGPGPFPTSNLNFGAGANTPNAVTVALPSLSEVQPNIVEAGTLFFRFDGAPGATTDLLVDVVGYMTESVVRDNERRLSVLEATSPIHQEFSNTPNVTALSAVRVVETLTIDTPQDGTLVVNSSARFSRISGAGNTTTCSITTGTTIDSIGTQATQVAVGGAASLGGTRGFDVGESDTPVTINLVCNSQGSTVFISDTNLTATYVPTDPERFAGG